MTEHPIGLSLDEVATPALVVDRHVLLENVKEMAARARAGAVQLWPHVKTHKSFNVAALQREHGATGFTVATMHEAERFAGAGFTNLLIASPPVGGWRLDRLTALASRALLRVVLDSSEALLALDEACARTAVDIPYLWEVDSGTARFGTAPGKATAKAIAEAIESASHCRFDGLMTFGGRSYAATSLRDLEAAAQRERDAITASAEALAEMGISARTGSIGSTPTMRFLVPTPAVTEIRPGNYVFNDATQVALGVAEQAQCALTVLATVLSRPAPSRAILDSGSKAVAAERLTHRTEDFGFLQGRSEIRAERLFEEHGILTVPPGEDLQVGEHVRLVPNHACASINLHDEMLVVEGEEIVDVWPVDARGFLMRGSM